MKPRVSLIVMSFNKRAYTEACLASLARSSWRPLEVVIVEQGSTDGSREMLPSALAALETAGMETRLISLEANVGAPAGRNRGFAHASGEFVGWMDNDVTVRDVDWLERLIGRLREDRRIGIISPKLLFPPPDERIEFAGAGVTRKGRVVYLGRGRAADDPDFLEEREAQCLISACVLLPRRAMEAVGPMDEAYSPVQYEDIDYCYRLKAAGYRCVVLPSVTMYHYEHVTTAGSTEWKFLDVTTRNGFLFRKRWRHVFEAEDGPSDDAWPWEDLERVRLEGPTSPR